MSFEGTDDGHWKWPTPLLVPLNQNAFDSLSFIVTTWNEEEVMSTAIVNSKGQITIPKVVRSALGITAGDRVEFVQVDHQRFELVAATKSVTALKGLVRKPAAPVTTEQMSDAIAAQASKVR